MILPRLMRYNFENYKLNRKPMGRAVHIALIAQVDLSDLFSGWHAPPGGSLFLCNGVYRLLV